MPPTGAVLGSRAAAASAGALGAGWSVLHATAPTVRGWRASTAPTVTAGPLRARVVGDGEGALVLLHGIVGCGAYFGAAYDALAQGRRLVVPDLLGFGDSYRSPAPSGYDLEAHLDALDTLAEELHLEGPLTVAGHSMGAVLALHWAARRHVEVERVVAISAPLYTSAEEGMAHVRGMGRLEEVMALDGPSPAPPARGCAGTARRPAGSPPRSSRTCPSRSPAVAYCTRGRPTSVPWSTWS